MDWRTVIVVTSVLTVAGGTIWLVPVLVGSVGWQWAFAALALGSLGGIVAMRGLLRLRA